MSLALHIFTTTAERLPALLWTWSLQAFLLIAITALVLRAAPAASPAARYRLWLGCLAFLAALPAWTAAVRATPLRQSPATSVVSMLAIESAFPVQNFSNSPANAGEIPSYPPLSKVPNAESIGTLLAALWCAIAAALCFRLCFAWLKSRRIRRSAQPGGFIEAANGARIWLGRSSLVASPQLAGIRHPMIVLPSDIEQWSDPQEIKAIVAHEIAHFDRNDPYSNLFQSLVAAVFFFHPAVRYALRQLSLERELACDERVLCNGADPDAYASAILKVARRCIAAPASGLVGFGSTRKILERRLDMIVNRRYLSITTAASRFPALLRAGIAVGLMTYLLLPSSELAGVETPIAEEPREAKEVHEVVEAAEPAQPPLRAALVPTLQNAPARPVQAAPTLGEITGRIYDASGALIPGATVRIASPSPRSVISGNSGAYELRELPAGAYTVEALLPGFLTGVANVNVKAGEAARRDFQLQLAPVSTRMQVTATRPAAALPPPPLRIGGDVAQANLISAPKPVYPAAPRALGLEGTVEIQAMIGTDGVLIDPRVINGDLVHPDLAQAALDAVSRWRYKPSLLNGVPVQVPTTISTTFSLSD